MSARRETGGLSLGRVAPTDFRPVLHPSGDPKGSLSGGHGRPPLAWPTGLSAQRGDRCPVGIFGHGLPVGGHFIWTVRIGGTCLRAHRAGEEADITQRAKVGCFPRCTRPTHIAVPARYEVGEFPPQKGREISLRMEHGPLAARYYAARLYARHWGYRQTNWDWAAQSFNIRALPLFDCVFSAVREKSPAVSPPPMQVGDVRYPKLIAHLDAGVSPPDKDLLAR